MLNAAPTDLTGKTVLVTGAVGGIGASAVEHFVALGATVYATDIADSFDDDAIYKRFDLLSEAGLADCQTWIAQIKPDVLFNNAALFDMGSVLDADLGQFDRLFGLNVRAFYAVMQSTAQSMVANKQHGSIINMASQAGHRGEALVAHYCATKAAVISYTQSAALALAEHKIRVNAISPGVIDTPMWKSVDALFAKFEGKEIGQKKREVGEEVPLGYMGAPADVARVAVFLASDQSSYMTAQTIGVDGGNVLR
ncbi:SDR family oxidoreductase [Planktotalea sp.]|uniref:SDR family oxidoreductase n=1 Tax=Planktotalea sp. TaxID=2029877 RepID=UPI003F6BF05F